MNVIKLGRIIQETQEQAEPLADRAVFLAHMCWNLSGFRGRDKGVQSSTVPPRWGEFALPLPRGGSRAGSCHRRSAAPAGVSPGIAAPRLAGWLSLAGFGLPGSASFTPRRNPGGLAGLASHLLAIKSLRGWESISSELSKPRDKAANERPSQLPTGLGRRAVCFFIYALEERCKAACCRVQCYPVPSTAPGMAECPHPAQPSTARCMGLRWAPWSHVGCASGRMPTPLPWVRSCWNKGTAWGGGGDSQTGRAACYFACVAIRAAAFNLFPPLKRLQGGWQMFCSPRSPAHPLLYSSASSSVSTTPALLRS
ncbi:uncharacterized protein LOC116653633 [Coturnix japonica]|uniref:uncharacterized protein LOC116653633 n=1 Tax=Coturnix japonica TaxID=93934 RepID=UPI0013A5EB0D|nr:uncharacterized protein LOC116653633 [Coturnix japonica]